jgi:hypothetical protein
VEIHKLFTSGECGFNMVCRDELRDQSCRGYICNLQICGLCDCKDFKLSAITSVGENPHRYSSIVYILQVCRGNNLSFGWRIPQRKVLYGLQPMDSRDIIYLSSLTSPQILISEAIAFL